MNATDPALPTRSDLLHPVTGQPLRAVGWRSNGTPIWPILGGNGEGAGDGGAGDGSGGDGGKQFTAPASQEELDRMINSAVGRAHGKYGMTADEAKAYKERVDKLEAELGSEADKAAKAARDEERSKANSEYAPRLVREAFKAEAKGVLSAEQLEGLLDDFNPANYLAENGDVDPEKIAARVAKFAKKNDAGDGKGDGGKPRQLGQGQQQGATSQPGDQGRAMAEKRFPKKTA